MMNTKHHDTYSIAPPPLVPGKLRLYSMRFCPFAQRIHLVLEAKKIPYDVVFIDLTNKPAWLMAKSPLGKVPCIELENGEVLWESLIVADYLNEAHPHDNLYPQDPLLKAKDKLILEGFGSVITATYKLFSATEDIEGVFLNDALKGLEIFNRELTNRGKPFFGGSKPGMLDFMIWPWCERADVLRLYRGEKYAIPRDNFLKLLEWRSAMKEDRAVKVSYLDPEIHVEFIRSRVAGKPNYNMLAAN